MGTAQHGGRRARLVATLVAVVLAVSGAAAVAVGLSQQQPAPPAPPTASSGDPARHTTSRAAQDRPSRAHRPTSREVNSLPVLDYSAPQRLRIPEIGVDSTLVDLGLDDEGAMETPEPVEYAGWFTPSPPPGVGGVTVLAGHVTWDQQPTVFFRLGELRAGDKVSVTRDDGVSVDYEVTRIGSFPKDEFPSRAVYSEPHGSELRLITCGGRYDESAHRYLANVVVWARAVAVDRG